MMLKEDSLAAAQTMNTFPNKCCDESSMEYKLVPCNNRIPDTVQPIPRIVQPVGFSRSTTNANIEVIAGVVPVNIPASTVLVRFTPKSKNNRNRNIPKNA